MRDIEFQEHFEFHTLAELKTWIDQFTATDLSTVYFASHNERLDIVYETERLSDGSHVNNVRILI